MKTENPVPSIQDSALRTRHSSLRWGMAMKDLFSILLIVAVLIMAALAQAQQPGKIPRIGFLSASSAASMSTRIKAFRNGLHELGYVEGKNIVIESRYADGKFERLPALAAELVRLKIDIIVSASPPVTRAAKDATVTIPIVMAQDSDPV